MQLESIWGFPEWLSLTRSADNASCHGRGGVWHSPLPPLQDATQVRAGAVVQLRCGSGPLPAILHRGALPQGIAAAQVSFPLTGHLQKGLPQQLRTLPKAVYSSVRSFSCMYSAWSLMYCSRSVHGCSAVVLHLLRNRRSVRDPGEPVGIDSCRTKWLLLHTASRLLDPPPSWPLAYKLHMSVWRRPCIFVLYSSATSLASS